MRNQTYCAVTIVILTLGVFFGSLEFMNIEVSNTATLTAVFAAASAVFATASVAFAATATPENAYLSWKHHLLFYLMIPLSVGGSIYLRLIEMPTVSYAAAVLSLISIYFYGMYLARIEERKTEVLLQTPG